MIKIKLNNNCTIKDAIEKLNKTQLQCLLIVNDKDEFQGTLTDGDIRRSILKGKRFNSSIKNIYNKKPYSLNKKPNFFDKQIIYKKMYNLNLNVVPIINSKSKKIIDIIVGSKIEKSQFKKKKSNSNLSVVIIAGGHGKRLEPFSKILPKPLLPIGEKPVIEYVLDKFYEQNFKKFITILNYKSKIIESYLRFTKYSKLLSIYTEKKTLGTIGGLRNIFKKLSNIFILTNCDVILDINYSDVLEFHKNNNFDLTIIASKKIITIPYGYCEVDEEGNLINMKEKPELDILTNVGFYVMNKKIVKKIDLNKKLNFDKFIKILKSDKKIKIGVYPIEDSLWNDVGEWSEYKKSLENLIL